MKWLSYILLTWLVYRSLTKPQTYIEMHPVKIAGHSLVNDEIEDIYDEIDDTYTKVGPSVDR